MAEKLKFLVRTSCEYSILIEAKTEEHACDRAELIPYDEWSQAWEGYTAEQEDDDDTPLPPGVYKNI